jgi:hypothetical protein
MLLKKEDSVLVREIKSVDRNTLANWKNRYGLTMVKREGFITNRFCSNRARKTELKAVTIGSLEKAIKKAEAKYKEHETVVLKATIERMKTLRKELNEKINDDKFKVILEQFRKENGLSDEDKISAVKLRVFMDSKGIKLSQKDIFKYLKNFM